MRVLLTGGSSGLGKAVLESLSNRGDDVYFTYRTHEESARIIEKEFKNTHAFFCDFCDEKSVTDLVSNMKEINPDALINNAYNGYTVGDFFYRTPVEDFEDAFRVNVLPLIRITGEAIRIFRKKKSGKIVTVLTSAIVGTPPKGYSVYGATKAYIAQLVKQWSNEYIQFGITSNAVSPDFMQTELTKGIDSFMLDQILEQTPIKKYLTVTEVAEVIVSLTDISSYVNGVNIPLNAGVNLI